MAVDCYSVRTLKLMLVHTLRYKDTLEQKEPVLGWSSARCERLGASMLDATHSVLPFLRATFPFQNGGIGDGLETPKWVQPGYPNPPSEHPYDTSVVKMENT